MNQAMRIGLFGGTFDPIHLGHVAIATSAAAAFHLDQVRFLPCRLSPHKLDSHPASGQHRLRMIELSVAHLPWAIADDDDLKAPEPSYSYLTVERLRARHPDARLFWIMGADQWASLPRWKESGRLAKALEFIVFPRGERPRPRDGWILHPLEAQHPASATEIRKSLREKTPRATWLDPKVHEYILANHLYQE